MTRLFLIDIIYIYVLRPIAIKPYIYNSGQASSIGSNPPSYPGLPILGTVASQVVLPATHHTTANVPCKFKISIS